MSAADLWTAVKARYDEQGLLELTNPRDVTASAADDTKGELAATGVIEWFPTYVQEEYDSTSVPHVNMASMGVIALLFEWGGTTHKIGEMRWDKWIERARSFASTHARARISPATSVPATKNPSDAPTTPHTPWSDNARFRGLMPRTGNPFDLDPDMGWD